MEPQPIVEFSECLKGIRIYTRLAGMETFQIKTALKNTGVWELRLQRSVPATVYTVVLIAVIIAVHVLHLCGYFGQHASTQTFSVSTFVNLNAEFSCAVVGLAGACMHRRARERMLQTFAEVDQVLVARLAERYKAWSRRSAGVLALVFAAVAVAVSFSFGGSDSVLGLSSVEMHFLNFRDLIIFTGTANYVSLVLLVRQRLNIFNDKLCGLSSDSARTTRVAGANGDSGARRCPRVTTGASNTIPPGLLLEPGRPTAILTPMPQLYRKLKLITSCINSVCGVRTLASILVSFTNTTMCLHYVLELKFRPSQFFDISDEMFSLVNLLLWAVLYLANAVAPICACDLVSEELKSTKTTLLELLLDPGLDGESLRLLRALYQQVGEEDMLFTAGGFFDLQLPTLSSMVGYVFTYLLALMQFNTIQK